MGGATPLSTAVLLVAKSIMESAKIFNKQTEREWRGAWNVLTEYKQLYSA